MAKANRYTPEMIEKYTREGHWEQTTFPDLWDQCAKDYPNKEAIVDSRTVAMASTMGIDLYRSLKDHTVLNELILLEEAIVTGHTGTNVNDLKFIILT